MEYLIGFLLIILLPASILFNIILLIRGINIVKQNEQLVDTIVEYDNKEIATQSNLESMLSKMKEIDIRGSFESDDEVGAVFSELKETIENYKTKSNNYIFPDLKYYCFNNVITIIRFSFKNPFSDSF